MTVRRIDRDEVSETMDRLGAAAREAARVLALASSETKNRALIAAAAIRAAAATILEANARDLAEAKQSDATGAFLDRLALSETRVKSIAKSVEDIAGLPDPVGQVDKDWTQPNDLKFTRVRVPLGVIGIIFESRPNVTADAGALCLKSGNAAILRAGSESFHSSTAIAACLAEGLRAAGLPEAAIQLVPTKDRAAVGTVEIGGRFERGDPIEGRDPDGVVLARGLSAYSADDAKRIKGHKSGDIGAILGYRGRDEMIHRDDLVLE